MGSKSFTWKKNTGPIWASLSFISSPKSIFMIPLSGAGKVRITLAPAPGDKTIAGKIKADCILELESKNVFVGVDINTRLKWGPMGEHFSSSSQGGLKFRGPK